MLLPQKHVDLIMLNTYSINSKQLLTTNNPLLSAQSSLPWDTCCVIRLNKGWGELRSPHSISVTACIFFIKARQIGIGWWSFRTKHAGNDALFWELTVAYTGTPLQQKYKANYRWHKDVITVCWYIYVNEYKLENNMILKTI